MKPEIIDKCLVCGSNHKKIIFWGNDALEHAEGQFPLVSCVDCGFIYLGERPSSNDIANYYPNHYLSFQKAIEDEPSLIKRLERKNEREKRIRFIKKFYQGPGRILDIGCATGVFLDGMRKVGWDVTGVETSSYAAEYARNTYKLNVHKGVLIEANFTENSFDVVTLWDVLEHVSNPVEVLHEIRRILKPGGIIVIGVPNPNAWERWIYGKSWPGWDIPRHFQLFDKQQLRVVLERCGMEWLTYKSFMGKHGTLVLAIQFWLAREKGMKLIAGPILFFARSLMARVITWPFYTLATFMNKSSYMTVVAKKMGDE